MPQPATKAFLKESWRATRSVVQTLHGYLYLRFPVQYLRACMGDPSKPPRTLSFGWWLNLLPGNTVQKLGRWFANGYHAKVVSVETATRLIRVERALALPQPETVLPYPKARDLILNENAAVALLDCPCRQNRKDPCLPLDVCILVGDVVVNFALAHHPYQARRVTPEEAVNVVRRCSERGMVTHAFFKSAVMGRFYAICNCCSCCCGAMQGHFHGVPMLSASGFVAKVDPEACVGCWACVRRCPFGAMSMESGPDRVPVVDKARCMGCGVCVPSCKASALSLREGGALKPLICE